MEILPDDIKQTQEDPLQRYYKSFKADVTRDTQTRNLRKILCEFLGPVLQGNPDLVRADKENRPKNHPYKYSIADFEARAYEFIKKAKEDPKWAEAVIETMTEKLKERTRLEKTNPDYISQGMVRNYYFPIQRLLESGDVNIPFKRLRRKLPKQVDKGGRGWLKTEISTMLSQANSEEKPLILIPASSGIREGGMWFKWKHIMPIYLYEGNYYWEEYDITESISKNGTIVCGLIHIYADSKDGDDYFAFFTPECWHAVLEYRRFWINKWGKEPRPDEPFFSKHGPVIRPLREAGLRHKLEAVLERCGYRPKLPPNVKRHEVPPFNGFRRFFDKATKQTFSTNSTLAQLILKEKMMGHDGLIRLNRNYFKEHMSELIQEYIPTISNLTISEAEAQKFENKKIKEENEKLRQAITEIEDMKLEQRRKHHAQTKKEHYMLQKIDELEKKLEQKSDR